MENRASRHGVVRAMALSDHCRWGLDAQMRAGLLERDLDLPAPHEPRDDLSRVPGGVGAEPRLGREAALGVADQHPRGGTTGRPAYRHTAVAEAISMARSPAP